MTSRVDPSPRGVCGWMGDKTTYYGPYLRTMGVEQNTLSLLVRYSSLSKEDNAMTQMD